MILKLKKVINALGHPVDRILSYKAKLSFASFGKNSFICRPLRIQGGKNIVIGKNVHIKNQCWLAALPLTGHESTLEIGDHSNIGDYNHFFATQSIKIGKSVLTACHVYISDNVHDYYNPNIPIIDHPVKQLKGVVIGEGSWLGENVCVIGASVGKHCVIGANAVVTKDIPDYSIAVGIPAKVIKHFDFTSNQWVRTTSGEAVRKHNVS